MKKTLLLALAFVLWAAFPFVAHGSQTTPVPIGKVAVCKYVGKPGPTERLQSGNNPIVVSLHAVAKNFPKGHKVQIGDLFADRQGFSRVIGLAGYVPSIVDCPGYTPPTTTTGGTSSTTTSSTTTSPTSSTTTQPSETTSSTTTGTSSTTTRPSTTTQPSSTSTTSSSTGTTTRSSTSSGPTTTTSTGSAPSSPGTTTSAGSPPKVSRTSSSVTSSTAKALAFTGFDTATALVWALVLLGLGVAILVGVGRSISIERRH